MVRRAASFLSALCLCSLCHADFGVLEYGTENVLGTGTYSSDPKAGATLFGLMPGVETDSDLYTGHGFPFGPDPGDFAGTDQIYVGSNQTAFDDGYSVSAQRIAGPDVMTMDYSSLVPAGQVVTSMTIGIAADDIQFPSYGNPFIATLNGTVDPGLSLALNNQNLGGPEVHFFTVGLDPTLDTSVHTLTLSIDEGGNGGDGWAVDFVTMGITTEAVPEPSGLAACMMGIGGLALLRRRRS